jgi:hypothetical protein
MWRGSSSDKCCGSETTYLFKIQHFTNIPVSGAVCETMTEIGISRVVVKATISTGP